ncbi:MAG: alpha/beta fold hydrolase [Solirubrobacterales bacterium]|nr:alpha/beta fold hydrolase [Solirubrobacterales bacterium]
MKVRTDERKRSEPWPGATVEFVATSAAPSIRVARIGAGEPLLLINGLGANLEMWQPLVRELAGRHELIAFDLPGTGRSDRPRWPLRMPQLARLVAELLDELGYEQLDVLGYSLGGIVAQELARREPGRIDRLVLCATTPGLPSVPPDPIVTTLMLTPARYWNRQLAELILPIIAGGRTARDPRVLRAGLEKRLVQPPTALGYLYQLYALSGWSSHPWLHRIPHESLVLHGDRDPVVPLVNGRYLAEAIPGGRLHVISGAGHLFLLDDPGSVVPVLTSFLAA